MKLIFKTLYALKQVYWQRKWA